MGPLGKLLREQRLGLKPGICSSSVWPGQSTFRSLPWDWIPSATAGDGVRHVAPSAGLPGGKLDMNVSGRPHILVWFGGEPAHTSFLSQRQLEHTASVPRGDVLSCIGRPGSPAQVSRMTGRIGDRTPARGGNPKVTLGLSGRDLELTVGSRALCSFRPRISRSHGFLVEGATGDGPLVLSGAHGTDEVHRSGVVGEDAEDPAPPPDLLVQAFQWSGGPRLALGSLGECADVGGGVASELGRLREPGSEGVADLGVAGGERVGITLREDRAEGCRHYLLVALRDPGEDVLR